MFRQGENDNTNSQGFIHVFLPETSVDPLASDVSENEKIALELGLPLELVRLLPCFPKRENMIDPLLQVYRGDYRYRMCVESIKFAAEAPIHYVYADMKNLSSLNALFGNEIADKLIKFVFVTLMSFFSNSLWCRLNGSGGDELTGYVVATADELQEKIAGVHAAIAKYAARPWTEVLREEQLPDDGDIPDVPSLLNRFNYGKEDDFKPEDLRVPEIFTEQNLLSSVPSIKGGAPGFGLHIRTTQILCDMTPQEVFAKVSARMEREKVKRVSKE